MLQIMLWLDNSIRLILEPPLSLKVIGFPSYLWN